MIAGQVGARRNVESLSVAIPGTVELPLLEGCYVLFFSRCGRVLVIAEAN